MRTDEHVRTTHWRERAASLSIAGGALLWIATLTAPARAQPQSDALQAARQALAAHDFARAREQAYARLIQQPADLDAMVVAGLAEFHAGQHARALTHFDQALAGYGSAAPIALQFNRASCLYELARFSEAEAAFDSVARLASPPLCALAQLNAGFCAAELNAASRAREHLDAARALDHDGDLAGPTAELAAEIDALNAGSRAEPGSAGPARSPNGSIERVPGTAFGATLGLGGGYDSNATHAGINQTGVITTLDEAALPSWFGRASAALFGGVGLNEQLFLLGQYDLEQLAYAQSQLDLYAAQDHSLELTLEQRWPLGLRLGVVARGALSFAGLRGFELLSAGFGGELNATAAYAERLETRLSAALSRTQTLDSNYAFLSGTRLELGVNERYRANALRIKAYVLYRDDRSGEQLLAVTAPAALCTQCDAAYTLPLAYRSARVGLDVNHRLLDVLALAARASVEWRFHRDPSQLELTSSAQSSVLWTRHEHQRRIEVGADLIAFLPLGLGLDLGYALTLADTNLDDRGGAGAFGAPSRDFIRHQLELTLTADF